MMGIREAEKKQENASVNKIEAYEKRLIDVTMSMKYLKKIRRKDRDTGEQERETTLFYYSKFSKLSTSGTTLLASNSNNTE